MLSIGVDLSGYPQRSLARKHSVLPNQEPPALLIGGNSHLQYAEINGHGSRECKILMSKE
jgi:hypothetical protein